ncbi:hypothetical protein [Virgibacillus kimchii]
MMVEGIMIFHMGFWKIWIDQEEYVAYEGLPIEIKIQNHYVKVNIGKDYTEYNSWFVEFTEDVAFNLREFEAYKVRVVSINLLKEEDVL